MTMIECAKCEKCGVPLTDEDFIPCDLENDECPLLADHNNALQRAVDKINKLNTVT